MTIWKFRLELADEQTVQMPAGARVLTAQVQNKCGLCLWAMVYPEAPMMPRKIRIIGTGHPCDNVGSALYISTVQMQSGALVFHVFEVIP